MQHVPEPGEPPVRKKVPGNEEAYKGAEEHLPLHFPAIVSRRGVKGGETSVLTNEMQQDKQGRHFHLNSRT